MNMKLNSLFNQTQTDSDLTVEFFRPCCHLNCEVVPGFCSGCNVKSCRCQCLSFRRYRQRLMLASVLFDTCGVNQSPEEPSAPIDTLSALAETQGFVENLFPSVKNAANGVAEASFNLSSAINEIRSWCDKSPISPDKIKFVLFVVNQILLIRDSVSSMKILQVLLSIYLFSGLGFSEAFQKVQELVYYCLGKSPEAFDMQTSFTPLPDTMRIDDDDDVAPVQMGFDLSIFQPVVDALADNSVLVSGAIIAMITTVCSLPFSTTSLSAILTKTKKIGDGAGAISGWVKSLLEAIRNEYYKHIYGCTKEEHDLSELIPDFYALMQDTYTLLSIPIEQFSGSKKLCDIVKGMYLKFQQMNHDIVARGKALTRELTYAFYALERKFLPLYDIVKASPLFNNVSRTRPNTIFFYGRPGVGKSNLVNILTAKCARRLYPNRVFNGENSVMWSRRIENEYHDGYAHQPFVQFDDCLQAVDSKANPNPELREVIYMVNDAPYQLHMSDIHEKKNTYFDSEHLIASSNQKIPVASSIADIGAFTRRFDFAVEVKVSPQFGKPHTDPIDGQTYCMVDKAKTSSALDTSIYQLHLYNLENGKPLMSSNSQPVVYNFNEFVDMYVKHCERRRTESVDTRKAIYDELGVIEKETSVPKMKGDYGVTQGGEMEMLEDGNIFAALHNVGYQRGLQRDVLQQAMIELPKEISPELEQVVEELDGAKYGDVIDGDDEDSDAFFTAPPRDNTFVEKVKERYRKLTTAFPKMMKTALERMKRKTNSVLNIVKKSAKWLFLAVGAAALVAAMVWWKRACKLQDPTKVKNDFNFFCEICTKNCDTCKYVTSVLGTTVMFGDDFRQQLGEWNLRAAEIMMRQNGEWERVAKHWAHFLEDSAVPVQMGRDRRGRVGLRKPKIQAESYARQSPIRPESYSRDVSQVAKVQAGSNLDFSSILASSEQYISVLFKNSVTFCVQKGFNVVRVNALFLRSRALLVNHHAWCAAQRAGEFTIRNPGQIDGTKIKPSECAFERVSKSGHDQDLVIVNLPRHIPSRPNILNKIVEQSNQAVIADCSASLVGFNQVNYLETMFERTFESMEVKNITTTDCVDERRVIRCGYAYHVASKPGDCGSLLFTHSTQANGKLIGFHTAGNAKLGQGYAEALDRTTLTEILKRLNVGDCEPVVGETHGFSRFGKWHDLGDVIHHGDSEFLPHQATQHEHTPSPLSGILAKPKAKLAHLKPVMVNGQLVDPMKKGLAKVANTPPRLSPKLLDLAVADVRRTLDKTISGPLHGVLRYEEAITGIEVDPYMGPIKRQTSPGQPWLANKKTTLTGKKEWLNKIVNGEVTDEYRTDEPELKAAVMDRILKAKQGIRVPALYTATLKDERRPAEKVDAVKTRVFAAAPQDYVLANRMYFLDFVASMMANRIENEVAVGIDHRTEWPELVLWLRGYGNNNVAGDFSNFDGSLLSEVLWRICDLMNGWYDDDNSLVREVLFEEIVNAYVNCEGHVIQWTHSQPSGNPLTVIVNSIFQMIMFRYVYLDLKAKEGLPLSCDFRRNVRMVTYGDDGVLSVKSAITSWFNQETITQAFAEAGLTYTDEAKSGAVYQVRPLKDISFLKRSFVETDGIWMGALDKDVIYEMCLWTRPKFSLLQTQYNCNEALKEALAHGEEFYNSFCEELQAAIAKASINIDLEAYTFSEMMEELYPSYF
nr:hypothetical protein 1 [Wenzhou shrimp virus 4]